MSQSAYTIRLDSDLKNRFDALCEGFGMSASTLSVPLCVNVGFPSKLR